MVVWTTAQWVRIQWTTNPWVMTRWTIRQWSMLLWVTKPWTMGQWKKEWWWCQWHSTVAATKLFYSTSGRSPLLAAWWVSTFDHGDLEVNNPTQIGSMVGCFLLGILYEGLKFYREFLMARGFRWANIMLYHLLWNQQKGSVAWLFVVGKGKFKSSFQNQTFQKKFFFSSFFFLLMFSSTVYLGGAGKRQIHVLQQRT